MTRVDELKKLIQYHSNLYYNKSAPEITDFEFDKLVDELKSLGGTIDVGAPSYGKKIQHSKMMGSLEKETTSEAIIEWANKYTKSHVLVTPKIDGLAVRLNYVNGKLIQAATRGDGIVGQDVTDNVRMIKNIPQILTNNLTVEVRGEILMFRSVFNEFIKQGIENLANPRNAASGSLMAKDPKITGDRNLSFLCYDVITDQRFNTEQEKFQWIDKNLYGIYHVAFQLIEINSFKAVADVWESNRPTLDYEIDGLVIAINNISEQEEAGWTGHRPKGKMAFKFKPEQKQAKVLSIEWQVGRTGKLTPVAYIEPTLIGGSTIGKMTLHNASILRSLNLAVNDIALIEKAGDIIPQVVRVVERSSDRIPIIYPTECPICKGPTQLDEREVSLWCINLQCPARFIEQLIHYISILDIMGVGEAIIAGLCEAGYVKSVPDLYDITLDQIKKVTGGDRSSEKVYNAIHSKKDIPLENFLDSLGIDGLGTKISKDLSKKFKTLQAIRNIRSGDLVTIEGIGDLTESKIIEGLKSNSNIIDRLLERVRVMDNVTVTGSLTGKSFCLTGKMSKPREEIEAVIISLGGEASSGVKKGLTYLVQADPTSKSGKTQNALKFGVQIISEDDLWKMIK